MTLDEFYVGLGGVSPILFVARSFFGTSVQAVAVEQQARIVVEGGYPPEAIRVKRLRSITLDFFRKHSGDSSRGSPLAPLFTLRESAPAGGIVSCD